MNDLSTEIRIGADASGVEAGVGRAKRSLKDLGDSARSAGQTVAAAGKQAGESLATVGDGGEVAAKKIQRDTRSMQSSLQRYLATLEAGSKDSRKYWESMADFKGVDKAALRPLLDQLDAYKAKANAAADASSAFKLSVGGFGVAATALTAVSATAGVAAKAMFDASVSAERLRTMLDFSTGGNSAREVEYLRGVTARLGLEFTSTAKAYGQFQAAAKGTALEGDKARAVFESVAKASAVMGLSADDTSGVLLALQQMLSKGTVSAEELRGQLGERLPGSFQVAARAMGVTTAELGKMLEQGQIVADDFLPKFGKALEQNLGGAAEKAANRLDASVNRLNTAWDRLKQNGGDAGTSSFMAGQYEILADGFNGVSEAMERARSSGSGFIGQMSAGAVAVAKFANPLQAFSYTAIESGNALKQAEEEFAALQARGDQMGGNIYYKAEMARLAALIKELKTAQDEKEKLTKGDDSKINPGIVASGKAREAYYNQRAKDEEAAAAFRLNLAGVPASYAKEMQELIRLNQAGTIVGKEYTDALKKQQDELLKKTGAVKSSNAAANQEQNAYESLIASIRAKIEADNLEIAGGAALTETQRIRIKLDQDLAAGRVKLTAQNERAVRLALEELAASEASALAAKTLAKANLDAAASREKYLTSLSTGLDKIKADTAAQLEATARLGLSKEAIAELDAAKLEMLATDLELQAIKAMDRNLDEQTYNALKQQAEAYRDLAAAKKAGATKEMALDLEKANRDAAKKADDEWQRAADDINRSLTDALLRGFESGKDFAKNMRDTVVNMFKTMVLRPVISAIVNPVAGAVTGMMGLSGAANAATAPSGVDVVGAISNGMSMLNTGINSAVQGTFSKFALSETGKSLGLSMAGPDASGYNMLSGTGQQMSQALGVVGDTLAGYAMGSMARSLISNGYSVGKGMDNFQKAGIAVGSALGGPVAGAIIGAGAGLVNRAFGRKLKDSGIQGTFGGQSGFEGESFEFYKGGWFRSDKTKTSPLDEEVRKALGDTFGAMRAEVGTFATMLGLETERLVGFTTSIKISTKGLDDKAAQEKIQEALATANNELAEQVIGSWVSTTEQAERRWWGSSDPITTTSYTPSEYAKEGEKAIDTLRRLATSLGTVNSAFELLGVAMLDASLASGDMASRLIEQSGGGEAFAANLGTYYENFYDQAEKTAYVTGQVTAALASVGLQMPATRDEFRAMVESQIALGDSGTQAVAALLGVSGAFAQVVDYIDAQFADLAKSAADVFSPLLESIKQARADVAGTRANMLKSDQAMTASQIAAAIGAAMVYAPSTAGVVGAQGGVTAAAQQIAQRQRALDAALAVASANQQSILAGLNKAVAPRTSAPGMTNDSLWEEIIGRNWQAHVARFGKGWNTRTTSDAERAANMNAMARQYADARNADVYAAANWQSGQDAPAIAAAQSALAAAQAALAAAQQAEVQSKVDYAAQINQFVTAAGVSVSKLSGLREEVVRYYEEQAAAVQSMIATAQNLRNVVGSVRMGQLDSAQTASQLGSRYASDYSMALATTGTTRAGYADSMASTLPTLAEAIKAEASTASDWRVQTGKLLAQATGVAGMLEADASGTDYQTTSLGLLDSIDTALAQLEGSTKSAEQVIAQAINDGTAAQLTGLRAVVAALRGDPIPAFATGGFHGGGLRLVGENGPELEVTGPSRIYSASQTAAMLSGGGNANAELVAELRALRADNQAQAAAMVNMQRELNKLMQRWDSQGMPEERIV